MAGRRRGPFLVALKRSIHVQTALQEFEAKEDARILLFAVGRKRHSRRKYASACLRLKAILPGFPYWLTVSQRLR